MCGCLELGGWSGATPSVSAILPVQSESAWVPLFAPALLSSGAMVRTGEGHIPQLVLLSTLLPGGVSQFLFDIFSSSAYFSNKSSDIAFTCSTGCNLLSLYLSWINFINLLGKKSLYIFSFLCIFFLFVCFWYSFF